MEHLQKRIKQYGIPKPPYLPQGNNVLIFRLPSDSVTAGGLIIPDENKEPKPMGVIIGAGLQAMDVMKSSLIELGDVVWFGKYAGWAQEVSRDPQNVGKYVTQMKIADVLGSCDALDRVDMYEIRQNSEHKQVYVAKSARKAS